MNLSQSAIAEMLGVQPSAVSRWEKDVFEPSDEQKFKLAEILGVSVAYLMGEQTRILRSMREEADLSLEEASMLLNIPTEELLKIEEEENPDKSIKKRIIRAYSNYLADDEEEEEEENQLLMPIQGGGLCGLGEGELNEALNVLAKDSLIRKSVRMMEDLTEEEKYKVWQWRGELNRHSGRTLVATTSPA